MYSTPTTPQIHGKAYKPSRIFNLHANKEPYDDWVMLSKLLIYDVNMKSNYVLVKKNDRSGDQLQMTIGNWHRVQMSMIRGQFHKNILHGKFKLLKFDLDR